MYIVIEHCAGGQTMEKDTAGGRNTAFMIFTAGILLLCALLLRPFFHALAWSVVFSLFAHPLYKKLHTSVFKGRFSDVSSLLVTLVILCFMLLPILWITIFLAQEAASAYDSVVKAGGFMPILQSIYEWLHNFQFIGKRISDWDSIKSQPYFAEGASNLLKWFSMLAKGLSQKIVSGTSKFLMLFVVVGFTSFYLLRDGEKIVNYAGDLLPLSKNKKAEFFEKGRTMLRAVVYGIVLTGFVQGVLGGIGWYLAKLPNPIFFGFMMFIFGMIPMIGTPAVWGFAVIYLLASGDHYHAFVLLAWCGGLVCTADNLIRPVFISGGSDINMLIVFLGLFGGLYLWGFIGLFLGPLVLSLGIFMLDIYREIAAGQKNSL